MTEINFDTGTLQATRNFLIQYLRDAGYEGSTEDGTAVHDTIIKPVALLLDLFKQQAAKAKAYLSLAEAEALKDTLGDEYDTVVDSILSNWFVERKAGEPAKVKVRLFFSSPPEVLPLSLDTTILQVRGIGFSPQEEELVFRTDFVAHINPYGGVKKYSKDVLLVSSEGEPLPEETKEGDFIFNVPSRFFVGGEVIAEVSRGTTQEDSTAFVARTKKAITTRELITSRAISTVLTDAFDEIHETYVAGYGSPEQLRDIHTFQGVTVHTGNKADIYVKTSVERITKNLIVQEGSIIDLSGTDTLRAMSVRTLDGVRVDYTVDEYLENRAMSLSGVYKLYVPILDPGSPVLVEVLRSTALTLPTDFVTNKDNRVGCYDPLVKEMFPIIWSGDVRVQLAPESLIEESPEVLVERISDTLIAYINNLSIEEGLTISTLISHLHRRHPEIREMITPLILQYSIEDPATTQLVEGGTSSKFTMPYGMSRQITYDTVQYYTDNTLINIIREL